MPLAFNGSPEMSMGVEMELQIIDAKTKDLIAGSPSIFERLGGEQKHIKPELVQAMIEINTGICDNVAEVKRDLQIQIETLKGVCNQLGYTLASSGSHPFARYADRILYPAERYRMLIDRNRWLAQRLMIFGLHVHVGMRDAEHAMAMNNAMLHYLPHLLALSASSPFWQGKDTGLASSRVTIFEALPTAGHPCIFQTWADFEAFYDSMIASKSITSIKDIWWDIRPHPDYGTIEIRICDGPATLEETVSLVALIQCLYHWFDQQYKDGKVIPPPSYWILRENKWKAARYGLEAEIILNESGKTNLLRSEIEWLIKMLEPLSDSLGCGQEFRKLRTPLERGCSYDRQRAVYAKEGTFLAVAESLIDEFWKGKPVYLD
ncbi:MAG TPA: glutamate--cysteine ligase [Bacteroidota bacterium]|nr:glutamate--cysteine ligase [Bacteroidota bacterium]